MGAPVVVTTLANGVRVATKQTFGEGCSMGVFVEAGTRSETKNTQGASYLIEQLAAGGSKKRPGQAFQKDLASIGATLDVAAGREQTSFVLSTVKDNLKQGVDL